MATFACTDPIDQALARAATPPMMHEALARTANRIGNPERMRLLLDSRDLPWSAAERLAHNVLRRAGIRGWKANASVVLEGRQYYIDIAFRRIKGHSRSTVGSTRMTRTCSRPTGGGRTRWCGTGGACCASPGTCCATVRTRWSRRCAR